VEISIINMMKHIKFIRTERFALTLILVHTVG